MNTGVTNREFHTIDIRGDLPKIDKNYNDEILKNLPREDYWIQGIIDYLARDRWDRNIESDRFKVQHMITNGPYSSSPGFHALFHAYLKAYNSHEDIILSPDDLWLMITIYFAKYVNANAETLRHLFVEHEDKIKLTIIQVQPEPDWNRFLEDMRTAISTNVKNDIVSLLTANYSTTGKVESLLSCATIMNTFKNYFDYGLFMTRCGIRKVHFMGTLNDWLSLRQKTEQLKTYTTPEDQFSTYIQGLLPILDKFIETYNGQVDNEFWDKIFNVEHVGHGSGSWKKLTGWFLQLCYGIHMKTECNINEVRLDAVISPVEFESEWTNEKKTCYVVGGFHGIESQNEWHKPVMSLAIVDDLSTITKRKE